jgi:hypothetical protein
MGPGPAGGAGAGQPAVGRVEGVAAGSLSLKRHPRCLTRPAPQHGPGHWRKILEEGADGFTGRTQVRRRGRPRRGRAARASRAGGRCWGLHPAQRTPSAPLRLPASPHPAPPPPLSPHPPTHTPKVDLKDKWRNLERAGRVLRGRAEQLRAAGLREEPEGVEDSE